MVNFAIEDSAYTVKSGTTWREFVDTADDYQITTLSGESCVFMPSLSAYVGYQQTSRAAAPPTTDLQNPVSPDDAIIEDYIYALRSI